MTSCPSGDELFALVDEELTVGRARVVEDHVGSCGACTERLTSLRRTLHAVAAQAPRSAAGDEAFVARTMAHITEPPAPKRRVSWQLGAAIAAAAALLLIALPLSRTLWRSGDEPQAGIFRARGSTNDGLAQQAGIEPFVVGPGGPSPLSSSMQLSADQGLTFRYSNLMREPLYLLAFAIDSRGELHWFYPAYLDGRQDPAATELAPGARGQMLPEVVQPESCAAGPLRVVTVMSRQRRRVKRVEQLLAGRMPQQSVADAFAGDIVDEWLVRAEETSDAF